MKVLVVSGFLGAGKTTFIKELASRTGKKFVILENEYGALGIDGDLLKEAGMGSDNIWEMSSGCSCCSKKGDFAASILTIANTINPEVSEHYTSMPKSWWDNILLKLLDGNFLINETDEISTNFDSIILENVSMFNPSEFIYLLEDIIRGFYGNIIRAKGGFMIGSIGLKFDLVDNKYSILSCDAIDKSSLVFIGKDINKKKLEKKFFKLDKKTKMRFRR